MSRFAGVLFHAISSTSIFYFRGESGCFDTDSLFKLVLHTWSLSVEEQFFLVWPGILLLLYRKTPAWVTPQMIVLSSVPSCYAAERWIGSDAAAAFFLVSFRFVSSKKPPPRQVLSAEVMQVWNDHVSSSSYDVVILAPRWKWHYQPNAYGK